MRDHRLPHTDAYVITELEQIWAEELGKSVTINILNPLDMPKMSFRGVAI